MRLKQKNLEKYGNPGKSKNYNGIIIRLLKFISIIIIIIMEYSRYCVCEPDSFVYEYIRNG